MRKVLLIGSVGLMTVTIGLGIAIFRVASTQLEGALSDLNMKF